ncbi:GtrA family protein [Yersinia enterocolitica]|uniref:GtrA family protein n=1 Tax=Yersinia enterocolitica TaxID=630 RepID=UPI003D0900C3
MIGGINTIIHGSILVLTVEVFKLEVVLSNFVSFMFANIFSYFMNTILTFKKPISFILYLRFLFASLLSLGLTLLLSSIAKYYGLHYLIGFVLIIIFVPILSFVAMKSWAFADKQKR